MKSYLKIFIPFLLALLLGSLTVTFAQTSDRTASNSRSYHQPSPPPPPIGPAPHAGIDHRLLEQLDLTDEQISKIGRLRDEGFNAERPYFEKIRSADRKLRDLSRAGSFDEEQAREILSAKAQESVELDLVRLRTEAAIYGVLTPEQVTQIETLKQKRPVRLLPPPDGFRKNAASLSIE